METKVTFVSWRRVTDLLSSSEPSRHSFLSSFIYLGAAQSQPCPSVGKRAYRVHLALTHLEMSCFSPGRSLNDTLILKQKPLSPSTWKHLMESPAPGIGGSRNPKANYTARWPSLSTAWEQNGFKCSKDLVLSQPFPCSAFLGNGDCNAQGVWDLKRRQSCKRQHLLPWLSELRGRDQASGVHRRLLSVLNGLGSLWVKNSQYIRWKQQVF